MADGENSDLGAKMAQRLGLFKFKVMAGVDELYYREQDIHDTLARGFVVSTTKGLQLRIDLPDLETPESVLRDLVDFIDKHGIVIQYRGERPDMRTLSSYVERAKKLLKMW